MKTYVEYAFYEQEYGGTGIGRDAFPSAALQASQYLKYVTLGRSEQYEGEELKYAACAIADVYHAVFGDAGNADDTADKKSESTDGYSVSYVTQGRDGETKENLFRKKAYECVRLWLAGTGLLRRSVRTC